MDYLKRAQEIAGELSDSRRYIHQCAELGQDLPKTVAFVKKKLMEMGYEPTELGGGVVATVGHGGKTFLLRADMDALPMAEESGEPFASTNGNCHMLVLVVTLTFIFVPLTFGGSVGWSNPIVLGGFAIGIIALFCFIKVEQKAKDPVIPLRLFKNKQYIAVLLVGFLTYFYAVPMNLYLPLAVQQVITGGSATLSGVLQLPRSILSIVIPIIAGMWVAKNTRNYWIALFICAVFSLASFAPLYYNIITVTGTAASRVCFHIVAKAVRMKRKWPDVSLLGLVCPYESPSASLSFATFDLCR